MATNSRCINGQAPSEPMRRLKRIVNGGALHFYKNNHMTTEISAQGTRHVLWAQDIPVVQGDQRTSVKILKSDRTNSILGTPTESMAYSPYGYLDSNKVTTLLAFNGQWFDHITKGYPLGNGYRALSTTLHRFLSPDSLSPFGTGGLNSYIYCLGDPVNYHDPSGHVPHFIRSLAKGVANRLHIRTPSARRTQGSPQLAEARADIASLSQSHSSEPIGIQLTPVSTPRSSFNVFDSPPRPAPRNSPNSADLPSYAEIYEGRLPSFNTAIARMRSRSSSESTTSSQHSLDIELTPEQIQERVREAARLTLLQGLGRRMISTRQSI
ncbi:RHS repeat-associated core domain-containing protein [Pseudomonas sp. NPDC096925]|uniref:RHS repeat-associated core domain-containing protein n=2 Tax=unclassified Pseudomonas TaxID=196821 RepID=UPI00383B2088